MTKVTFTTAAGAAAVLLAAGCSSGSSLSASNTTSNSGSLSPIQAITLAANHSKQVTSFSSTLDMKMSGESAGTITGSFQEETKPSLLMNVNMSTLNIGGQNLPGGMQEILVGGDLYMKMSILQQELHKPWVVVPLSALQAGTGINFSQLMQQVQTSDPLVQTQMFTSAKNARVVGTATIDGVQTTEYAGSYSVSQGIAKLPSDMRSTVTKQLQLTGISTVQFKAWIDGQHQVRKIEVAEPGSTESVDVTMQITGIGQQVNITIPPKSETATLPASDLSGL